MKKAKAGRKPGKYGVRKTYSFTLAIAARKKLDRLSKHYDNSRSQVVENLIFNA